MLYPGCLAQGYLDQDSGTRVGSGAQDCFFQIFVFSWFDFGLTQVIGQGRVSTLSLTVWQYLAEADPYIAAAGSCLLLLPPALLMLINEKTIRFRP